MLTGEKKKDLTEIAESIAQILAGLDMDEYQEWLVILTEEIGKALAKRSGLL